MDLFVVPGGVVEVLRQSLEVVWAVEKVGLGVGLPVADSVEASVVDGWQAGLDNEDVQQWGECYMESGSGMKLPALRLTQLAAVPVVSEAEHSEVWDFDQ